MSDIFTLTVLLKFLFRLLFLASGCAFVDNIHVSVCYICLAMNSIVSYWPCSALEVCCCFLSSLLQLSCGMFVVKPDSGRIQVLLCYTFSTLSSTLKIATRADN